MKPFYKKPLSTVGFIISLLFLVGSYSLTIYLFFLQINTAFSQKRLLASIAAGIVLTALYYYIIKRLRFNEKFNCKYLVKTLLAAVVICGFFWMTFPTPKNYLLAPRSQFDINIHRLGSVEKGVTQLTYLNSGLDYVSPEKLQFEPVIPNNEKGVSPTLVFNAGGEARFSWQGRAWRSIVITLDSTQPIEVFVHTTAGDTRYQFDSANDLTIKIPVANSGYYFFAGLLFFLAMMVTLTSIFSLFWLVKWDSHAGAFEVEVPQAAGMKFIDAMVLSLYSAISLVIVVFGLQNKLYADDYCYILNLKRLGWQNAIQYYLRVNNGRYSSHIFDLLGFEVPAVNNLIGPITALVLIGGSLFYLFLQLLQQYERRTRIKLSALFSVTLVGSIFLTVPFLHESFIWNLHSIIVSGGFACFIISSSIFIKYFRQKKSTLQTILWICFFFLWGLLGAGFAEVTTVLNLILASIALLAYLLKKGFIKYKNAAFYLLSYILSNGIGLLVMTKVPGSAQRMDMLFSAKFSDVFPFFYKMIQSKTALILTSNSYLSCFVLLLLVICGYIWGKTLPQPLKWNKTPFTFLEILILVLLPIITYFTAFFPLAFFRGYFPPRTLAIPICYTLIEVFVLALIFGNSRRNGLPMNKVQLISFIVLLALVCLPIAKYLMSYSRLISVHNKEWDSREIQILQSVSQGKTELVVYPLEHPLGTDLSTQENLWLIDCVSDYYGIDLTVKDK